MEIKKLREKTGLSQSQFASKFHIHKHTLQNWEQGVRHTPPHVLFMIERILYFEEKYRED